MNISPNQCCLHEELVVVEERIFTPHPSLFCQRGQSWKVICSKLLSVLTGSCTEKLWNKLPISIITASTSVDSIKCLLDSKLYDFSLAYFVISRFCCKRSTHILWRVVPWPQVWPINTHHLILSNFYSESDAQSYILFTRVAWIPWVDLWLLIS